MPRQKLSEYRSKVILYDALDIPKYGGLEINTHEDIAKQLASLSKSRDTYVVKVDQAIKGRFKKGLVKLNVAATDVAAIIKEFKQKGYQWALVEPMQDHAANDERFFSIQQSRDGYVCTFNEHGGVEVEAHKNDLETFKVTDSKLPPKIGLSAKQFDTFVKLLSKEHVAFLEINPFVAHASTILPLDVAIEVDDSALHLAETWGEEDFRTSEKTKSEVEQAVIQLKQRSAASFKLQVINPNGSIFLLLSGGGASIAVADEYYQRGHGDQLANYGEYSGNPNREETKIYTEAILELLVNSTAKKKILFLGGAVANFTDIATTFQGIIDALAKYGNTMKAQGVKVHVRRGGPNQAQGLQAMREALQAYGILGAVHGPELSIASAVSESLKEFA
jgi:ATP-citrate lyase beta-subunit